MKPRLFCLWLLLSAAVGLFAYDYDFSRSLYFNITSDSTVKLIGCAHIDTICYPRYIMGSVVCKGNMVRYRVTSIGEYVFRDCRNITLLTSITIPEGVTSIGDNAFSGCSGLTSIIVENENPKYDSRDNCNAIIETSSNTLIVGCKATTIPEGVTSIGGSAFQGSSGLTSITIPNSVTSIGDGAFQGCSGLTSITIPNSVTSIGYMAFYGCSGLTSITIGNSVTSIGESFSADCYKNVRNFTCKNPDIEIPNGAIAWFSQDVLDTIVMPANGFDVSEEKWANCLSISNMPNSPAER